MDPLYDKRNRTILDPKRFSLRGRKLLFKSRIAMPKTPLGDQHYNQWYQVCIVPADVPLDLGGLQLALARAFLDKGHTPLTEDEVRAAALNYALVK